MPPKMDSGVVLHHAGIVVRKDADNKVSFLKNGAVVHPGDVLQLISGRSSVEMLFGSSTDLPSDQPYIVDEGNLFAGKASSIDELYALGVEKGLDKALIQCLISQAQPDLQGRENLAVEVMDGKGKLVEGEEAEISIDAVLSGITDYENLHKPMIFEAFHSQLISDAQLVKKTSLIKRKPNLNINPLMGNSGIDLDVPLRDSLMQDYSQVVQDVQINPVINPFENEGQSDIADAWPEVDSPYLLQANVSTMSFMEGDQLLLENKNGVQFDINTHQVLVDKRLCLQFNITQQGNDISYDFSSASADLVPTHVYERVIKAILFRPFAHQSSLDNQRSVSILVIDDTGMSYQQVLQFQVNLA